MSDKMIFSLLIFGFIATVAVLLALLGVAIFGTI